MSSLNHIDILKLETIFGMGGGYVMNFTNQSFQSFISKSVKVNIYSDRYSAMGDSKAKRLRVLWDYDGDITVGKLTEDMLKLLEAEYKINNNLQNLNKELFDDCLQVAHRLQGKVESTTTVEDFLKIEVDEISIELLRLDDAISTILSSRISEVKKGLNNKAPLSVIFLCGSILEGVLLSVASKNIKIFNEATSSPKEKDSGKVKKLQEWSLSNFIEVAHELKIIGLDVKKHSHSLRDFRNYIHPYQQMSSGFDPDFHTAKICWQVLKAALHDIHESIKSTKY